MKRIYSFDGQLYVVTGVHKVLMDIHNAIKDSFDAKVLGTLEYEELNPDLHIKREEYRKIGSIFSLRNSILIVHQRRLAVKYRLLSLIPFLNLKVVYVHHNILTGQRRTTLLPKRIITISDRCIENLTEYFGVPRKRITKIYNAVIDKKEGEHSRSNDGITRILYTAKIFPIKRQIQLVENIKEKLNSNIQIIFAGDGEDLEQLKKITENDSRFKCLGFTSNIAQELAKADYCMLFSEKEGLPISLIEATMMGVPIICNNVGGNLEIAKDGYNAFICDDWDKLIEVLNHLSEISGAEYERMSKNSREHYERYFNYEMFKIKYTEYLKRLQNEKY